MASAFSMQYYSLPKYVTKKVNLYVQKLTLSPRSWGRKGVQNVRQRGNNKKVKRGYENWQCETINITSG